MLKRKDSIFSESKIKKFNEISCGAAKILIAIKVKDTI